MNHRMDSTTESATIPQLHALLSLSRRMLEAARTGDWEAVAALEAERQAVAGTVFKRPVPLEVALAAAEVLRATLAANQEMISLGEQARDAVRQELQDLVRSRKAERIYSAAGFDLSAV
jgi:flagellar protein FliT